jgi:hypothetical protein
MTALVVRPTDALSQQQFGCAQVIYEDAFRPELRVPFTELTRPGHADQAFVAMEGESPVGFAAPRLLGSVNWSFLRYFAIAGGRRGEGLGGQFWRLLHPSLRGKAWPACIVFEVEDPGETAGDAPERVIRERRIRFWTACGARPLPASEYVMPDYTARGATERVLLMAATPAGAPAVRGDRLRRLILAIYTDRYGMAADDPVVSRALASIAS